MTTTTREPGPTLAMVRSQWHAQLPNLARWILLATITVAFGLRVFSLDLQAIWWDEARNIEVALRPLPDIAGSPELDIHPPLYFWLLHLWLDVTGVTDATEARVIAFSARFFSVLWGTATVCALFVLAQRGGRLREAMLATALGGLAPFWIAESQEARMYTLSFFLLTMSSLALLGLWRQEGSGGEDQPEQDVQRVVRSFAFGLLCTLALITHYNALFIVVAWYGAWLTRIALGPHWRQSVRAFGMAAGTIVVLTLPFIWSAWQQIEGYENPNLRVPTIGEYLIDNASAYLGGYAFDSSFIAATGEIWLAGIGGLSAAGLLWLAGKTWRRGLQEQSAALLILVLFWLIGGLSLYYIAVLDRGAFNVRYSSFVTPALYALLGLTFAPWASKRVWATMLVSIFLLVPLAPAIAADRRSELTQREDTAGLAVWLRQETKHGDVIFVDQKYPLGFYYDRYTSSAFVEPVGAEGAPARYLFVDINTIDEQLNEWAGAAERVFWVRWYESDTDPRRAVTFLLDQAGSRAGEQLFRGYEVDWWEMQPPNNFEMTPDSRSIGHRFGEAIEAIELSLPATVDLHEQHVPVTIRWQRVGTEAIAQPLKARVAVYDASGNRVSQVDSRLLNDRHLLPAEWTLEDRPLNVYLLELPEGLLAGIYEVKLLVYDADTLGPIPYDDRAGNEGGVEPILGQFELVR